MPYPWAISSLTTVLPTGCQNWCLGFAVAVVALTRSVAVVALAWSCSYGFSACAYVLRGATG